MPFYNKSVKIVKFCEHRNQQQSPHAFLVSLLETILSYPIYHLRESLTIFSRGKQIILLACHRRIPTWSRCRLSQRETIVTHPAPLRVWEMPTFAYVCFKSFTHLRIWFERRFWPRDMYNFMIFWKKKKLLEKMSPVWDLNVFIRINNVNITRLPIRIRPDP